MIMNLALCSPVLKMMDLILIDNLEPTKWIFTNNDGNLECDDISN